MATKNKFKCPVCGKKYTRKQALYEHLEKEHPEVLGDMSPAQFYFNWRNKKKENHGRSIVSGKPTPWNEELERYEKFANEEERQQYRQMFVERMQKKYGKDHLLDDPDMQKRMLQNRRISGEYTFKDGTKFTYTGSYEKDFLEVLDQVFGWPGRDIMLPAPQIIEYKDPETNRVRFYIPDAFIASLNLIIEIKSEENKHYRQRDLHKEKAKDAAVKKTKFNYIKISDKDYVGFVKYLKEIRESQDSEGQVHF